MQEMHETWVWTLVQEGPLEEEMATCDSFLAWTVPWAAEELEGSKEVDTAEPLSMHAWNRALRRFSETEWGLPDNILPETIESPSNLM